MKEFLGTINPFHAILISLALLKIIILPDVTIEVKDLSRNMRHLL